MKVNELGGGFFSVLKNEIQAVRSALWFRPTAFCVAAFLLTLGVAGIGGLLPEGMLSWLPAVEKSSLRDLLNLLSQGMLTVTTVTLSVLMLVLSLTADQASPRAVPEVMADPVTQNALGSFLATFVFSLTALMLLGFDGIGGSAAPLLFLCALALIMNAIRYLVQWIHHVAEILKLNCILKRIYDQAAHALENYLKKGDDEGCVGMTNPGKAQMIRPKKAGYVQLVDGAKLRDLAEKRELVIRLAVRESDFVHPRGRLMEVQGAEVDEELEAALRLPIVIHFEPSAENDPLLGFDLLAEVACRALSPGINDPQSALVGLDYLGGLLTSAAARAPSAYPPACLESGRVQLLRVDFATMLERALRPVMRDGAAQAEVICKVMAILSDLAETAAPDYLDSIAREAARAEAFGKAALTLDADKQALSEHATVLRKRVARRLA